MQVWNISKGQASFNSSIGDVIQSFETNINDYMYDVEPQSQNLFFVGNFTEHGEGDGAIKQFYNAQYRIRSIKTPDMNFTIENNLITHTPVFKEVSFNYDIQIDWFEDVYHSVRKYHEDWMRRWYDRVYDVLRCGTSGKFRKLDIIAYHYVKGEEGAAFDEPKPEPLFVITLSGLVPANLPGMKFDYGSDQNEENVSIQYKCARADIRYNSKFTSTDDALYDTTAKASGVPSAIWSPQGINSEYGGDDTLTNESLRIARASTTRYDSMPLA